MLSSLIYFAGVIITWVILVPKLSTMEEELSPRRIDGAILLGVCSLLLAMIWPVLLAGMALVGAVRLVVYRKIRGPWW